MRKLTITDVGPITKTASIEYKRFCILIGPQSTGKSTIAKILSTCMWLEKEACTNLSVDVVSDGKAFKTLVEDFHRMHNYIHPDRSVVRYESPYITINYDKGNFSMVFKDPLIYERVKISYMPSDRNIITMKDIEKRDLEPTNFRSFLFDWLDANRNFSPQNKIAILNLGMNYYHDDKAKDRKDMLTHKNGVTYDIPLYDASSGMQSLVPMTVLMHYFVSDYFANYDKNLSFEQGQKQINLAWQITEKITTKYYPDQVKKDGYKKVYLEKIKSKEDEDEVAKSHITEMQDLYKRLVYPKSISFVLEEPEQNIFPQTQVELFNDIISLCNGEHTSSVFITTHSPYVLAAANILLFASKLASEGIDEEKIKNQISTESFMPIDDFSAYTISDGTCRSLIDESTGLISENELDSASEYNAEVFEKLYQIYIQKLQQQ